MLFLLRWIVDSDPSAWQTATQAAVRNWNLALQRKRRPDEPLLAAGLGMLTHAANALRRQCASAAPGLSSTPAREASSLVDIGRQMLVDARPGCAQRHYGHRLMIRLLAETAVIAPEIGGALAVEALEQHDLAVDEKAEEATYAATLHALSNCIGSTPSLIRDATRVFDEAHQRGLANSEVGRSMVRLLLRTMQADPDSCATWVPKIYELFELLAPQGDRHFFLSTLHAYETLGLLTHSHAVLDRATDSRNPLFDRQFGLADPDEYSRNCFQTHGLPMGKVLDLHPESALGMNGDVVDSATYVPAVRVILRTLAADGVIGPGTQFITGQGNSSVLELVKSFIEEQEWGTPVHPMNRQRTGLNLGRVLIVPPSSS
jgi:hypothetical protein